VAGGRTRVGAELQLPAGKGRVCVGKSRGSSRQRSAFNRMKHWRGLASRFDKHAVNYRGGVVLVAIVDWLKQS
jgi:transposase